MLVYHTGMDLREITCKTALVKSGIPGVDYVINPYTGCAFGCKYCYASFMGRFVDREISEWGSYVYVKTNIADVLAGEAGRLATLGPDTEIFLSSVTDPYQGAEASYKLTRRCLQVLSSADFPGTVSVLTKSPLVTRDMDVFSSMRHVLVGLTVTSTDDGISRYFETHAPPVSSRLKALRTLNDNSIATYAFIGPLLPHYVAKPDELERVFSALAEAGTTNVFVEHLNLSAYIRDRLVAEMGSVDGDILTSFYASQTGEYRSRLDGLVTSLAASYGMRLLTDTVIFHKEYRSRSRL